MKRNYLKYTLGFAAAVLCVSGSIPAGSEAVGLPGNVALVMAADVKIGAYMTINSDAAGYITSFSVDGEEKSLNSADSLGTESKIKILSDAKLTFKNENNEEVNPDITGRTYETRNGDGSYIYEFILSDTVITVSHEHEITVAQSSDNTYIEAGCKYESGDLKKIASISAVDAVYNPNTGYVGAERFVASETPNTVLIQDAEDITYKSIATGYTVTKVSNKYDLSVGEYEAIMKVTINGKIYTLSKKIEVTAKNISDTDISATVTPESKDYDGKEPEFAIELKYGDTTLREGTDYTYSVTLSTLATEYPITIKGIGNYTGETKLYYNIDPIDISDDTDINAKNKTYDGQPYSDPVPIAKSGLESSRSELVQSLLDDKNTNKTVTYYKADANGDPVGDAIDAPTEIGKYVVKMNLYHSEVSFKNFGISGSFEITPAPVTVTMGTKTYAYSTVKTSAAAADIKNAVGFVNTDTLSDSDKASLVRVCKDGKDVTDTEYLDAGTYTYTIDESIAAKYPKYIFDFEDKELVIEPLSFVDNVGLNKIISEKTENTSMEYNGSEQQPVLILQNGITKGYLTADKDYICTDFTKKEVGKYTAAITGTGNYTGSFDIDWEITKANQLHPTLGGSPSVTFERDDSRTTYNGIPLAGQEPKAFTNVPEEDRVITIDKYYKSTDSDTKTELSEAPKDVGKYEADVTISDKNENYLPTTVKAAFTISKASASVKPLQRIGNTIIKYEMTGFLEGEEPTKEELDKIFAIKDGKSILNDDSAKLDMQNYDIEYVYGEDVEEISDIAATYTTVRDNISYCTDGEDLYFIYAVPENTDITKFDYIAVVKGDELDEDESNIIRPAANDSTVDGADGKIHKVYSTLQFSDESKITAAEKGAKYIVAFEMKGRTSLPKTKFNIVMKEKQEGK
ncbi:MAG: hypothetical protein IJ583_05120 [Firmicutes bacterium]|nr:hypothetical protein [Bacillota bacterium]